MRRLSTSLYLQVLLGVALGIVVGLFAPHFGLQLQPLANGFDFANGRDLIVVESPEAMAEEILRLSSDAEARRKIEANTREAALQYGWKEIAQRQTRLYESLTQLPSLPSAVSPFRG